MSNSIPSQHRPSGYTKQMASFRELQKQRQAELIQTTNLFDYAEGYGTYRGKKHPYILKDGPANLYSPICESALRYFSENSIQWWGGKIPTGNTLSSQVMCVNHLFSVAQDKEAVLSIINGLKKGFIFIDVLPIECDERPQYISFEVVSDNDYLNEGHPKRGAQCTSVDALILAKHQSGSRILIMVEWKYTESYNDFDKFTEVKDGHERGQERQRRYNDLITSSAQLTSLPAYQGNVYYQEPFYQLMRQTLWAEQMVAHQQTERIKADDYLHLHVIPDGNKALLEKKYKAFGTDMETTWRSMLNNKSKYLITSPQKLFEQIIHNPHYSNLVKYLEQRYW